MRLTVYLDEQFSWLGLNFLYGFCLCLIPKMTECTLPLADKILNARLNSCFLNLALYVSFKACSLSNWILNGRGSVKMRKTLSGREGWPLKLRQMGTYGVQMKVVLPSLGSSRRYNRFLSCLDCSGQPSTKYFSSTYTISIYVSSPPRVPTWSPPTLAGSRAGPPVSECSSTYWFYKFCLLTLAIRIIPKYLGWGDDFSSHLVWAQGAVLKQNNNKKSIWHIFMYEIRKFYSNWWLALVGLLGLILTALSGR